MKRYSLVRWLGVPALIVALLQLNAAVSIFLTPRDILPPSMLVGLGLFAAVWATLFGVGSALLLSKRPNAILFNSWLVLGLMVSNVVRQLIFTQADYERGRIPFLLTVSTLIALIPLTTLVHHYWRRGRHHGET